MLKRHINRQLGFSFDHSESSLRRCIETSLGRSISLILTDNSTTMLSANIINGLMQVRLHRMFLNADDAVVCEIISALQRRKSKMPNFRRFIESSREKLSCRPSRKMIERHIGRYYNLREIFNEINREYFDGAVKSAITWGRVSLRGMVRKRTLGSYSQVNDLIRINTVLDRRNVPQYFLAFVVYHEMLHSVMSVDLKGGRRIVHSKEFKQREKLFKDYERACAWEKNTVFRPAI